MAAKVFIIAGHNERSPGAIGYDGITEHSRNVRLQSLTTQGYSSAVCLQGTSMEVVTDDQDKSNYQVRELVNSNATPKGRGLDIHFNNNNPLATGCEAVVHPNTTEENKRRVMFMLRNVSNLLGIPIRRRDDSRDFIYPSETFVKSLPIIENTKIPFILFETCFLNQNDLDKYIGKEHLVATILREGMMKFDFRVKGSENYVSSVFISR